MGNVFFSGSIDIRRVLSALVAIAFLMASAGIGHAMPAFGPHDHPAERGSLHEEACHAGISQAADCAENAAQQDQGQPAKHGTFENCCVVACSSTIVVAAITEVGVSNLSVIRLDVHVDQVVDPNTPNGLFRPPRSLV